MRPFLEWSQRHPLVVILLFIAGSCVSFFSIRSLKLDASAEAFMTRKGPEFDYYQDTLETFGSDTVMIIYVEDSELFTVPKLTAFDELVGELYQIPGIENIESLFSVRNVRQEDGFIDNSPLMDWVPEFPEEAQAVRDAALENPILVGNFISADATKTSVNMYLDPKNTSEDTAVVTAAVAELMRKYEGRFDRLFEIGQPYLYNALSNLIMKDLTTLVPVAVAVLLVMLFVTMASPSGALLPMLTASFSVYFTFAFMAAVNIPINMLTFIVPVLVIVIGSTEDTHILSEYLEGLHEQGSRPAAIRFMASKIGTAVLLTSLTTFLGFISISLNQVIVLQQFGISSGFALFINPVVTVLLSPVYLSYLGTKKPGGKAAGKQTPVARLIKAFTDKLLNAIHNHRRLTMYLMIGGAFFVSLFSYAIRVDNDVVSFFRKDSPVVTRMAIMHEELSGAQFFYTRISCAAPDTFKEPIYLSQIEAIEQLMRDSYEFDKVTSISDYLKLINREMNFSDQAYYVVPESKNMVEQYLLMLHREEIDAYVTAQWNEVNIVVRHNISSSQKIAQTVENLERDIGKILDPRFEYHITGENILVNRAANTIALSQIKGLGLLLVIILVIMSIVFTDVKAGLLSLIPNAFPIAIFFGIMGVLGLPLNIGTCMVAAIAIGISVDDTIHFMTRYNAEMRRLQDRRRAIESVLHSEALPVISTSLSLMLGFGIMVMSHLTPIAYFGILSALVMVCALLADLLLTPILLTSFQLTNVPELLYMKLQKELAGSPLFAGMTTYQIKKFILLGRVEDRKPGEYIIKTGELDQSMYVMIEGAVEVVRMHPETGQVLYLAKLGVGDIFGEIALLRKAPRSASVVAMEPVSYLKLDWEGLKRIQRSSRKISMMLYFNIARILGTRLVDMQQIVMEHERKDNEG